MRHHFLIHAGESAQRRWVPVVQAYAVAIRARGLGELSERASARMAGLVVEWEPSCAQTCYRTLSELRARHPLLPMVALVPDRASRALHCLSQVDVECVSTDTAPPVVHRFVQRAIAFGALPDEAVARWVSYLAETRGLTPREVQLITFALGHVPRARMRRVLGVTENTLKSQVRGLLRKVGERSLDGLAKNLLRTALLEARPGSHGIYRAPWVEGAHMNAA